MLDYDQIVTVGAERQATYLAAAEQRRLADLVAAGQLHPIRVWCGQQLIAWGEWLMSSSGTEQRGPRDTPEAADFHGSTEGL